MNMRQQLISTGLINTQQIKFGEQWDDSIFISAKKAFGTRAEWFQKQKVRSIKIIIS